MKKAAFIIATQYDNLGDLIINKCLIDELSNHVSLYVDTQNVSKEFVKHISDNDKIKVLKEEYNFTFKNWSFIKYLFKYYRDFSFIFRSPGPIFYRETSNLKDKLRSTIFKLIYKKNKSNNGKSYVIGSEYTFESENLISEFVNSKTRYDKYLLRSMTNVEYLKSLKINNVEYIPDLCFLMKEKVNYEENKNRKKVGISFRDLNDDELNGNIARSIESFITFYTNKNYEIIFFYQVERDFEYNNRLYSSYSTRNNVSFIEHSLKFDNINIYNEFESVISNRLHVLLLGFITNGLTFPIINNNNKTNKIKGIYDSISSSIEVRQEIEVKDIESIYNSLDFHKNEILKINIDQYELCKKRIAQIFN